MKDQHKSLPTDKQFSGGLIKQIDKEKRQVTFVVSDGEIDRHGDSLNPNGWQLENYMKNPVVLFGHDYKSLPIGKTLKVWVENGKQVLALFEFATHEFAQKVFDLIVGGFLNATSVGFIPLKWDESGDYTFAEMELLEISVVPVPANPRALGKKELEIVKSLEEETGYTIIKADENSEESVTETDEETETDNQEEEETQEVEEQKTFSREELKEIVKEALQEVLPQSKNEDSEHSNESDSETVTKSVEVMQKVRDYLKDSDKAVGLALRAIKEVSNTK